MSLPEAVQTRIKVTVPVRKSISSQEIDAAIDKIASEMAAEHKNTSSIVLAAIANGGIVLSEMLRQRLSSGYRIKSHKAVLDISFYRDDIGVNPIAKEVEATELVQNPEESTIILVDDVLFTGRSARAALSEIHALGRPRKIELATLVDRGNRILPIQADYTGLIEPTSPEEKVVVHLDTDDHAKSHIDILSS